MTEKTQAKNAPAKKTIPYTKEGESYERTVSVSGDIVTRKHVTKHKTGEVYLTWHFDFSGCTKDQILELASRAVVIGERPRFKVCPQAHIPEWDNKTFDVAAFCARERSKKSPLEKIQDALGMLSEEEKKALLERLQ